MNRTPNFQYDNNIGKIGENDFINFLNLSPKIFKWLNVSDDEQFQKYDVDFLIITNDNINKNSILTLYDNNENYNTKDFQGIDVKTDTVAIKTRNTFFETISFNKEGCCIYSKADYIYYVFLQNDTIKERFYINLKKWRKFVEENKNSLQYKTIPNGHASGYLCNIENLVNLKIAINLNEKFNEYSKINIHKKI